MPLLTERLTRRFMAPLSAGSRKKGLGHRMMLWVGSLLIGLASAGAAWGLQAALTRSKTYGFLSLQGVAYDRGMTNHARSAQESASGPGDVVLVEVRESTYQEFAEGVTGLVPGVPGPVNYAEHPRAFHARVVENLTRWGAKVIVFDMVFDAAKPGLDGPLAEAMRRHGKVILAGSQDTSTEAGGQAESASLILPTADLREAAAALGIANVYLDTDDTLRRFTWWFDGMDEETLEDRKYPALGAAAAALFQGTDPKSLFGAEVDPGQPVLGKPVAWETFGDSRSSFIRYYGQAGFPSGPGSVIQYEQVVRRGQDEADTERLKKLFGGKLVVIGDATLLGQDIHRVPVISSTVTLGDSQRMPGVEVQAHIAQTILKGEYPRPLGALVNMAIVLLTCVGIAVVGRVFTPGVAAPATGGVVALLWFASIQGLAVANVWWEPVTATAGALLASGLETTFMYFAERRQRLAERRQLERHVGAGVAGKLAEGEWPDFGGETREITMLFSDLQGFTSISENMTSLEICSLLNRYFGVIFPIMDRYGGTLDKLMGDGMMCYFGFPVRHPDHAARAIRCALEMQEALDEWQQQPEFAGTPGLRTRIGIHTGGATIGEIGAGDRAEFTVIGDVVNVASRLEGMNKDLGTTILISENTRNSAGEIVPMTPRGVATVRGRREPLPVYSLESTGATSRQRAGTGSSSFQVTDTHSQ